MKKLNNFLLMTGICFITSCSFFGEKNKVSDYIEKPDYSLKSVEFVPVLPNFGEGIEAVSLYAGYDQLLYVVDKGRAILSYDVAGNQLGMFPLAGVQFVIQNRSLDLYALGRIDTIINTVTYNLPVIYKINQKNSDGSDPQVRTLDLNAAKVEKKLIYPFIINESGKLTKRAEVQSVQLSSIGFLEDNSYYVTSNGLQEGALQAEPIYLTRRNAILTFSKDDDFQGGFTEGNEQKSIAPLGLTTLVQPPQRSRMETKKDYIYTSITPDLAISVRYIEFIQDSDGGFSPNFKSFGIPNSKDADGFMYQPFRFKKPVSVLYAGVNQKYIFVADQEKDSVYAFQENGYEGAIPPPQYTNKKIIKVSFGGHGSGPYQFDKPSALAYFNRTLFVADAGNKRIVRYKLTSDYE